MVHSQGEWPQFSHSTVLYQSYSGRCFTYDVRCLKVNAGGDRWQRMFNAGMQADFLQEVVTLMPLRHGEAERAIFQPEWLNQATHDSHDSENHCYLFATISDHN